MYPRSKSSIIEVIGKTKTAALSCHCNYLATSVDCINSFSPLFILYIKEKRQKKVKNFTLPVNVLYFSPMDENVLLLGCQNRTIYVMDVDTEISRVLEGHEYPPLGMSIPLRSTLLITWSISEVLIWLSSTFLLTKRLKVDPNSTVVLGGHIWEKNYLFAAFNSGTVLLWDQEHELKERIIQVPDGVEMEFKSFSISLNGEWLVGVGSQPLLVTYSLVSEQVIQVVHLSHTSSPLGVSHIQFLPAVHPQFQQCLLLMSPGCIVLTDFIEAKKIKLLKSQKYDINHVCVSLDGSLMGVSYSNGSTKLYTLLSYFPAPLDELCAVDKKKMEIDFKILKLDEEVKQKKRKIKSLLDITKWQEILNEFGEYPAKYRKHIWANILHLPKNFSIFSGLLQKGEAIQISNLEKKFPNIDEVKLEALKSTMKCLCFWAPFLSSVNFLPEFIFPFVDYFEPNILLCFEVSITVILNWCRFWFEDWPKVPSTVLKIIDQLICDNEPYLWVHLRIINVTAEDYAWSILFTSFSKVLSKSDWLIIWDHIFSQPPSFMICVAASFTLCLRQSLLRCSQGSHAKTLYSQETWIPAKVILQKSKKLFSLLKSDAKIKMDEMMYLPKGDLTPFNIGPKNVLKSQSFILDNSNERSLQHLPESLNVQYSNVKNTDSQTNENKISSGKTDLNWAELRLEEEDCLKRILRIRQKQANRI